MLDILRAWLNGNRNYFTGVVLYSQLGDDKDLLAVLEKGPNDFRVRRLQEELLNICNQLKNVNTQPRLRSDLPGKSMPQHKGLDQVGPAPANPDLYAACKAEADHLYKKVMNDRAVLFSLARESDFADPNLPEKIKAREKLAIDVVTGFQKVSRLYDRADYVAKTGRLPEDDDSSENEIEQENIPDSLVKQQLDNARKAFSKLKNKEATPARVALMQKHEINIKKLEEKWRSLQPE